MRTVAVERAEPGPELPVYHFTVLAEPLARLVADDNGEPETRSGGWAAVTVASNRSRLCREIVSRMCGPGRAPFASRTPAVTWPSRPGRPGAGEPRGGRPGG